MNSILIHDLRQLDSADEEINELLNLKQIILSERQRTKTTKEKHLLNEHIEDGQTTINSAAANCDSGISESIFKDDEEMHAFLCYIFERRFGWSETVKRNEQRIKDDLRNKSFINCILDDIFKLLIEEELSRSLLAGFQIAIQRAHDLPVVRSRTVIHVLDWINLRLNSHLSSDNFDLVKKIIMLGLCDVWSVIRNSCIQRLGQIIECFNICQLKTFAKELFMICESSDASWQSKEGAVMGVTCIIRRFQWVGIMPEEEKSKHSSSTSDDSSTQKVEYFLKFGKEELKVIPNFISSRIEPLIYGLLAHPQLTVREQAIKAYSLYISRCEFSEALSSFNKVIDQLCQFSSVNAAGFPCDDPEQWCTQPLRISSDPNYKFLDAFLAEGLLGLCVHLVKHIPPGFLLPNWPRYFYAFNLHLMHPASTVRQATSVIFKFIVAKGSSNPTILKLVLQSLIENWFPNMQELTTHMSEGQSMSAGCRETEQADKGGNSWQWKEGRLLAYELIFQFLIKNHWLYTFGSSLLIEDDITPNFRDSAMTETQSDVRHTRSLHHSFKINKIAAVRSTETRPMETADVAPHHFSNFKSGTQPIDIPHSTRSRIAHRVRSNTESQCHINRHPCRRPRFSIATSQLSPDQLSRLTNIPDGTNDKLESFQRQMAPSVAIGKSKTVNRRESVSGYGSPSLHTLVRHYTYYNKSNAPFTSHHDLSSSPRATSLLLHSMEADNRVLTDQSTDTNTQERKKDWFTDMKLKELSVLFRTVLYQCIECLADSQWELRRMGHQLLPCVVEVIRWYDMKLLTDMTDRYLTGETSLMNYGLSLAVKHSMVHAAFLLTLLRNPPSTWLDIELCEQLVTQITKVVQEKLEQWLTSASTALQRLIIDKISLISLEILLLGQVHFYQEISSTVNKSSSDVINLIANIFCQTNSRSQLADQLKAAPWYRVMKIATIQDFLSCCTKPETEKQSYADQVERNLLPDIQKLIPFATHNTEMVYLMPIWASYVSKYYSDESLAKAFIESLRALSTRFKKESEETTSIPTSIGTNLDGAAIWALKELVIVIKMKNTDVNTLKTVLDVYCNISTSCLSGQCLTSALQAIASRINIITGSKTPLPDNKAMTFSDLTMMSNDIPTLPLENNDDTSGSDEDDVETALDQSGNRVMLETQLLNTSNGSSSVLSPRSTSSSLASSVIPACSTNLKQDELSDESDWDNASDDDNENQTELIQVFSHFVRSIRLEFSQKGNYKQLEKCIQQLSEKDRKQITAILG